jgi:hypothetical protein
MATEGKTATYGLNFDSNAADIAKAGAEGLAEFSEAIDKSSKSIKDMQGVMRTLKGASDEVKSARAQLKARIDEERGAVSAASLALLKGGVSVEKLGAATKKTSGATKEIKGPINDARKAVNEFAESLKTGEGAMNLATVGAVALGAGLVYAGAKAIEGAIGIGRFVLRSADSLRNMDLMRQAAAGGAENAKKLGEQVDALAGKIPTSTEELNKLAVSLVKTMSGGTSRASGQAIVDTFNAVGEAASAMGDDTGRALQDILTRSQRVGRITLNPFELQGKYNTGYEDISAALAKNMRVGVNEAKIALATGRVSLDAGAKAIRDAVETRFGEINAKKLLSIDAISTKLHDNWVNLTKGVDLEAILKPIAKVVDLFKATEAEGYAIQGLFTGLGKILGSSLDGGADVARVAIDSIIIAAQNLELEWLNNRRSIKDWVDSTGGLDEWKKKIGGLIDDARDLADAVMTVVHGVKAITSAGGWVTDKIGKAAFAIDDRLANVEAKRQAFNRGQTGGEGPAVYRGGVEPTRGHAKGGMIQKPDKGEVFVSAAPGETIVPSGMAMVPRDAGRGGGATAPAAAGAPLHFHFHVDGGQHAAENVAALQAPGFLSEFTRALREVLHSQGIPTQVQGTP